MNWNEMGIRERLFSAYNSLMRGQSIAYAEERAGYNPNTDRVSFSQSDDLSHSYKVDMEGSDSIKHIRKLFPNLFSSDQAVLNAVAIEGEERCEFGCEKSPHPGYQCEDET